MRSRYAAALLVAFALGGCAASERRSGPIDPRVAQALASVHVDPAAALSMLNAYRASHALDAVRLDPALVAMCQRQADAMAAANTLSHTIDGRFAARLALAGVKASEAGENLGGGYYSAQEAMAGWRNSPEHDANLLLANVTRFGVALAKNPGSEYGVYWAMVVAADPPKSIGDAGMAEARQGESRN